MPDVNDILAPNGLLLSEIHPDRAAKYSPNLYQYLNGLGQAALRITHVFRKPADNSLWIGYVYDGMFSGSRLNQVLCYGKKAGTFSFVGLARELVLLDGFWGEYVARGRCAIDTAHVVSFLGGERWSQSGDNRICLWCGHRQVLARWTELVERSAWESA